LWTVSQAGKTLGSEKLDGNCHTPAAEHAGHMLFAGTSNGEIYGFSRKMRRDPWRRKLGGTLRAGPVCKDGFVYATNSEGKLFKWSALGEEIWKVELPQEPNLMLRAAENRLLVGTLAGNVCCLDAENGKLLWQSAPLESAVPAMAIFPNFLLVGTRRSVEFLSLNTGETRRKAEISGTMSANPAHLRGILFGGSAEGQVFAYSLNALLSQGKEGE
jgi:outer membrane protein assembly factor BamB